MGNGSARSDVTGLIGKGMTIEGKLVFEKTLRLDGHFSGEIEGKGTLVVGDGAEVDAQVNVDNAIISGLVRGCVVAAGRVEIRAPGKVFGEIKTPNLVIGEGGVFEGNSIMMKKPGPAKPYHVDFGGKKATPEGA